LGDTKSNLMKMKILLVGYLLSIACLTSVGQQYVSQVNSVGFSAGSLSYSGRFSIGTSIGNYTSWAAQAFYKRRVLEKTFVKVSLLGGQLKADNRDIPSQENKPRGMFKTGIVELSVLGEYDLVNLDNNRASPFIMAGAGGYYLAAHTTTEDEKPEADKIGFVVPVGGGVKYRLNDRVKLLAEGSIRFFSKNLDGRVGENISNPNKYYSVSVGMIYELSPLNSLW